MTEPTITCPNCKTEIRLTESLAAPLIAATRQQFERQLAQKDEDIARREQGLRDKEKQIAEAKRHLEEQVADQVAAQLKAERARVVAEESKKAKQAAATELEGKARELAELQEVLKSRDEKLAEAQRAQVELIKKQRELDDAKRELELTVEKRVQDGQFQIYYQNGADHPEYQPDFVAETAATIYMLEPKKRAELKDPIVIAKKEAAVKWCVNASDHAASYGGKPWLYVLIPHDEIAENITLDGLAARFGC